VASPYPSGNKSSLDACPPFPPESTCLRNPKSQAPVPSLHSGQAKTIPKPKIPMAKTHKTNAISSLSPSVILSTLPVILSPTFVILSPTFVILSPKGEESGALRLCHSEPHFCHSEPEGRRISFRSFGRGVYPE